jgi:integrase
MSALHAGSHATDVLKFKRQPTKRNLNKRTVASLTPPGEVHGKPAQEWIYDSETPRLAICCWSSGAKVWYWVGRCNGRMIRFKLGSFPEITPEQARKLAMKTSADVASGIDPRVDRQKRRGELTLAELFALYLERHAKAHKKTWKADEQQFNRYCQSLKGRPLSTIKRADIGSLHTRVGKQNGKYAANRLLALLSKLFSFSADHGFDGMNPCKGVKKFHEQTRERFLDADDLRRFFEALKSETTLFQDFFSLLLWTGARRGNVAAMEWKQIDLDKQVWRIPMTKSGDGLTVPLTPQAVDILKRRLAESGDCPFVFQGGKKNRSSHLKDPKQAWERLRKSSGLPDVRMHDLRRTLGSWQAAGGASLPVIGKSLGHKNQSTTQIYARLALDPVRESVNKAVSAMVVAANETATPPSPG